MMQVDVRASDAVAVAQVRQLLAFHLSALEGDIERVTVSVCSSKGDRRGEALQRCRVKVKFDNGDTLITEEMQFDRRLAVTRALGRSLRRLNLRAGIRQLARRA